MKPLPVPPDIAEALSQHSETVRARLLEVRELIFAVAEETEGVGPITETLKWGEPAYLTEVSRSGTTIRLGRTAAAPEDCAVLFNCKTTLIETFRYHFDDVFAFDGNRALILPATGLLPRAPLMLCLRAAMTYHRRKGTDNASRISAADLASLSD